MMIPVHRILRKNVWCDSDEHFIADIADTFDLWIQFVEYLQSVDSVSPVDVRCFNRQDTNNNNNDSNDNRNKGCSGIGSDFFSSMYYPSETCSPINSSSENGTNGCSNGCTAESGKQKFSLNANGPCSKFEWNEEISSHRIPKILHFIWLGSEIPEQYSSLMTTWRQSHASWDVKIWTDEGEERLHFPFYRTIVISIAL